MSGKRRVPARRGWAGEKVKGAYRVNDCEAIGGSVGENDYAGQRHIVTVEERNRMQMSPTMGARFPSMRTNPLLESWRLYPSAYPIGKTAIVEGRFATKVRL